MEFAQGANRFLQTQQGTYQSKKYPQKHQQITCQALNPHKHLKPKEIAIAQELSLNPYNGSSSPIKRPDQKSGRFRLT